MNFSVIEFLTFIEKKILKPKLLLLFENVGVAEHVLTVSIRCHVVSRAPPGGQKAAALTAKMTTICFRNDTVLGKFYPHK